MLLQSTLLFLLMGSVITVPAGEKTRYFRKDYTYLKEFDAFFKFHKSKVPFSDAVSTCKAEGAHLFLPSSLRESEAVYSLGPGRNVDKIWIGLHDLFEEGTFFTLSGESIDDLYSNWAESEPNNDQGNEHCAVLLKDMTFNDISCERVHNFACTTPAKNVTQNVLCETYDTAYTYEVTMDACYKLHTIPLKWKEAFKICRAEESRLAIINSDSEAKTLVNSLEKYPENKLAGTFKKNVVFVGFNDIINPGVYITIEGKPLSETGYVKWASGQPDNRDGNEHCGSMDRDGALNDMNCDEKAMFFCEKTLVSNVQSSVSTSTTVEPPKKTVFNVAGALVQLPDAK